MESEGQILELDLNVFWNFWNLFECILNFVFLNIYVYNLFECIESEGYVFFQQNV